ncbi:MAG: hypothetical protein LBK25_09665 [Treponema sp.]|nr:hypothetical protein [Treponema sp.]
MKKINNKVREGIMVKKAALKKALGVAVVVLGTLVTACSESESEPKPQPQPDPNPCECLPGQEHWDACECGADEGECDCTVIDYKTLTNGIRVYRGDGVMGEQMDAAVVNVQNGWDGLDAGDAALMDDKVERIIIVSGANGLDAVDAKWVVKLGATQDAAAVTTALKNYLDTQIDPLCVCVEKNHLGIGETCECDGLRDCECGLQVYGTLGDAANTPIYRSGDVSDTDMATAVANAQSAYQLLDSIDKLELNGKIHEMRIMSGGGYTYVDDGKLILSIVYNMSVGAIKTRFTRIGDGTTQPTIAQVQTNSK